MSDVFHQYRADFIRIADEVLRTPGVPKKVFARVINGRFVVPLRKQNIAEDIISDLRSEAFRIFESRRAVSKNRQARKQAATPHKQANGNNEEIIRYGEANVVERVNGVRR